ncbi:MAG: hypothetical protein ABWY05_14925 [Noviherbaspirillum sp.]
MQKEFEVSIDGMPVSFTARTGVANDVGIYESGASAPCVVLTENNGLERILNAVVDKEELLDIAILQTINQELIQRARQTGEPVHESLIFVKHPD